RHRGSGHRGLLADRHLGRATVPRRADGVTAGPHRAAHREPRLRRSEPRRALTEPVCHRLPRDAGGWSVDRAGGPAFGAGRFHRADAREPDLRLLADGCEVAPWPRPRVTIAQNNRHRKSWTMRGVKAAFRVPAISPPPPSWLLRASR